MKQDMARLPNMVLNTNREKRVESECLAAALIYCVL